MSTRRESPRDVRRSTALRAAFCGLALALTLAGSADADDSLWDIGFGFGSAGVGNDSDLELRAEFRTAYRFTDHFGLEGEIVRARAVLDSSLDAFLVNGVFELRPGRAVEPYVLGGLGAARLEDYELFSSTSTSNDGAAFQVAVGTRVFFGQAKRVGARMELSSLWEATDVFGTGQHTSLTAGMTWRLGR